MSALIFDPIYPSYRDRTSQFSELARERMSRPVCRLPFFHGQMDGQKWLESVWAAVEEAEIIICLGDYITMLQVGSDASRLLQRIREKASEGCPILLQVGGMRHNLTMKQAPDGMEDLLKSFGCNPTDTRVGSDYLATSTHSSPYVCEFNNEDNSLTDPELFDGVHKLVGHGAYLLDYEAGSFPIVEASSRHFLVDGKSDFFASGIPGRRNAVAIRRRRGRELQIVFSVNLLKEGYDSLGGYVAGIEENRQFAANLIDFIDKEARSKERDRADAYDRFATLERMLGQFVHDVLVRRSSSNSLDEFLPERVRKKLWDEKMQRFEYSNAYFADIVEILRANWPAFEAYFDEDRSTVSRRLFGVNGAQRINLAHPHKAHQLGIRFGEEDVRILKAAVAVVQNAVAKFSRPPQGSS